jgi:electron transport complex protein RnfE
MSAATAFVLICSSTIISLIKKIFATEVRIMGYIVIVAAFVTLTDIIMKAKFFELSKSLGPFIPLIVVNCIILGRAEAFASKNGVVSSLFDALGMSIGFLLALTALGSIRELLGTGMWLGFDIVGTVRGFVETSMPSMLTAYNQVTTPWVVMILAPGAFFGLAVLIAIKRTIDSKVR